MFRSVCASLCSLQSLLLPLLALLFILPACYHDASADAAVIAIDFGSEFIKVSSSQGGFHIVVDEQSKRKVPAVVSFDAGERHFGNGATALAMRKPKETYMWAHGLLGQHYASAAMNETTAAGFPYEFVPVSQRGSIGYQHSKDSVFSVEEVIGMSFQHIAKIAEADAAGAAVKDAIVTVPPFWSQRQRQALLDAAELAGFNVLALLNENSAAAIQYGIDRVYSTNDTHTLMLYNMGSSSTKVDIARYSAYTVKDGRKGNKTIGQVELLSRAYDETLGGHAFELRIAEFIVKEVNKQLNAKGDKTDIRTVPRAMAKIRSAAEKAKVVLSANQDTPIFLGSLHNDIDFKTSLSRADFQTMCADLIERATAPIDQALQDAQLQTSAVDAVTVIGGAVRIPALQAAIKSHLKREALHLGLNGDEAMAMGAVFRAANLSATHHVRPFGFTDVTLYPVGVRIANLPTEAADSTAAASEEGADFSKRASLFRKYNRLGKRKTVQFSHTRDFTASLFHDSTKQLPRDIPAALLSYNVTGVTALMSNDKYAELLKTQKPRIALSFLLDASGITSLVKAEATLEETIKVPVVKPKLNTTATANATTANGTAADAKTDSADAAASDTATDAATGAGDKKGEGEEEVEYTTKKKTHTVALRVIRAASAGSTEPLSLADKSASRAVLTRLSRADELKKEIAAAKNTLESYIYATRSEISDEKVEAVSTQEQRDAVTSALSGAEEWLYEQSDDSAKIFKDKLAELKTLAEPIFFRLSELSARATALNTTTSLFNFTRDQMADYAANRPWVKAEDRTKLLADVDALEQWLNEQLAAQAKLSPHEEPAFTSADLYERLRPIAKQSQDLMKIKKPYEKPKPKPSKSSSNSSTTNVNITDAANGTEAPSTGKAAAAEGINIDITEGSTEQPKTAKKDEL